MDSSNLWSLRLGFSGKQALEIDKNGIQNFLKNSFSNQYDTKLPDFLQDDPKTLEEFKNLRSQIKNADSVEQKKILRKQLYGTVEMKNWWLTKMQNESYPLREKMVCFWHNHFVATAQKVKGNYWIYQHNMILRENAFGNFKELTKKIVKSNAMVRYLDNVDNKKGNYNENLSRELLELFTLGIGNYSEDDIKNGAKALAGLGLGEENAIYRRFFEDNDDKTYLGKTGNLKADDLVNQIFKQKNISYLITRKILKWFIYDNPKEELVLYYGDYFRKMNFEIEPLLTKVFTEEYAKPTAGSKIKNPLEFLFQMVDELQITNFKPITAAFFAKQQGMDLFNQVNVKGWDGGNSWLTSQIYLQRNNTSDLLINGRTISRKELKVGESEMKENEPQFAFQKIKVAVNFDSNGNNKNIIAQLSNRLLFKVDEATQKDMETILKYDFNAKEENANDAVLRLYSYIAKTPEYQLI
ncbi:MAG: DUF1800 domain-containing protein [Flavobacterium sp.]|nr:DUF1800 domain-containing protein [Flavobacterium sp.]